MGCDYHQGGKARLPPLFLVLLWRESCTNQGHTGSSQGQSTLGTHPLRPDTLVVALLVCSP